LAAQYGEHPDVITALMNAGADVNAVDRTGKRPVDYLKENDTLKGTLAFRELERVSEKKTK
jgi:hypothetical protein